MMKFIDVYALAALLQLLVLSNAALPSTISITKPASLNVFSQDRNITAPFDNSLSNMSRYA